MPHAIAFDRAWQVATVSCSGVFRAAELEVALAAITTSAEYPPTVTTIWDFSAVDWSDVPPDLAEQWFEVRRRFGATRDGSRVVFVAPHPTGYGVARMFALLAYSAASQRVEVVRTLVDAQQWVVLDRDRR